MQPRRFSPQELTDRAAYIDHAAETMTADAEQAMSARAKETSMMLLQAAATLQALETVKTDLTRERDAAWKQGNMPRGDAFNWALMRILEFSL